MATRRELLAGIASSGILCTSASLMFGYPRQAHAQVVEGIGLLVSAYQVFGKKGGDGGISALLKATNTKLDLINRSLSDLTTKLDLVIEEIWQSTDTVVAEIQRSEMRTFTSAILTQAKRYDALTPLIESGGIEAARSYRGGVEIGEIRTATQDAILNALSEERAGFVQPIDLITLTAGLSLFVLADMIEGNNADVRLRASKMMREGIVKACNIRAGNGVGKYVEAIQAKSAKGFEKLCQNKGYPPWAKAALKSLLNPAVGGPEVGHPGYTFNIPNAVWLIDQIDVEDRECDRRTRTVGSANHGTDREEEYCEWEVNLVREQYADRYSLIDEVPPQPNSDLGELAILNETAIARGRFSSMEADDLGWLSVPRQRDLVEITVPRFSQQPFLRPISATRKVTDALTADNSNAAVVKTFVFAKVAEANDLFVAAQPVDWKPVGGNAARLKMLDPSSQDIALQLSLLLSVSQSLKIVNSTLEGLGE